MINANKDTFDEMDSPASDQTNSPPHDESNIRAIEADAIVRPIELETTVEQTAESKAENLQINTVDQNEDKTSVPNETETKEEGNLIQDCSFH